MILGASLYFRDNQGSTALTLPETAPEIRGKKETVELLKDAGDYVAQKDSSSLLFFA